GSGRRVGAWVGENVIDLNKADAVLPSDLRAFIDGGEAVLDRAQLVIDRAAGLAGGVVVSSAGLRFHAPWPGLRVACIGVNYARHATGRDGDDAALVAATANRIRERGPWGFWKVPVEV